MTQLSTRLLSLAPEEELLIRQLLGQFRLDLLRRLQHEEYLTADGRAKYQHEVMIATRCMVKLGERAEITLTENTI